MSHADRSASVLPQSATTLGGRIATGLVALVVGVAYGLIATVGHQSIWRLGELVLPWGLVIAVLGAGLLVGGFRLVFDDRWAAIGSAIGLVGVVALLSLPGAGGSILVRGNLLGTIWVIAPALIAAVVIAWPDLRGGQRRGA